MKTIFKTVFLSAYFLLEGGSFYMMSQIQRYMEDKSEGKIIMVENRKYIWNNWEIPVCFERSYNKHKNNLVKKAIIDTWQKNSDLQFTDWCECKLLGEDKLDNAVRIVVQDSPPNVKALGREVAGVKNGVSLNYTFLRWGSDIKSLKFNHDLDKTIMSVAAHEFGHVLGFTHQHQREFCFDCFQETHWAAVGKNICPVFAEGIWTTGCDRNSIMNYCGDTYFNDGVLSSNDKKALAYIYSYSKKPETEEDYGIELLTRVAIENNKNGRKSRRELIKKDSLDKREYKINEISSLSTDWGNKKGKKQKNRTLKIKINKEEKLESQEVGPFEKPYKVLKFKKINWYKFEAEVRGKTSERHKEIEAVQFFFHHTVDDPIIKRAPEEFKASYLVYGNFDIRAVVFLEGNRQVVLEHELTDLPPISFKYRKVNSNRNFFDKMFGWFTPGKWFGGKSYSKGGGKVRIKKEKANGITISKKGTKTDN